MLRIFFRGQRVPSYIESLTPKEADFEMPRILQFRPRVTVAWKREGAWHLYPFGWDKRRCVLHMTGGKNLRISGHPTIFHRCHRVYGFHNCKDMVVDGQPL